MKENRRIYSKEFKQKAVELSHVRGNVNDIARELGVRSELLYRLRREFALDLPCPLVATGINISPRKQKKLPG